MSITEFLVKLVRNSIPSKLGIFSIAAMRHADEENIGENTFSNTLCSLFHYQCRLIAGFRASEREN